jgi:hypothetical protein
MHRFAQIVALCLALAGVETLHGIVRIRLLLPRLGRLRAQRISIVSGSLLALLVCALSVPQLGVTAGAELLALGVVLALFMAGYDVAVSRWLMKRGWRAIRADFDPRQGNLLVVGLAVLAAAPALVMLLAGKT